MRAAIYRRVSGHRQVRGASLDQQHDACQTHAAAQGWQVVADYVEAGRSAYTEDLRRRPAFQQMLADARARRFDVLLVYELSRFARRQRVQFSVAGDLEGLGIRVISVTEPIDPDTIGGFVTYSVLAMQAELHSRILSRRMRDVRAGEAAHGRLSKRAALGQVWQDKCLVWDDAAAALPRRAYELAATGLGTPAVLAQLLAEGHHISLSSLHYVLRNPAYAGLLRHRGRLMPAAWPPLVERGTWDAVQAQRAARHPKGAVRATVRARAHATLGGLVYCANCGAKLHYDHHAPPKRNYYHCACREEQGHCDARPSRADRLEEAMGAIVAGLVFPDEVIDQARAILEAEHRAVAPPPAPSDAPERLRRLARAYADGAYSDDEYERRRAAILAAPTPAPVLAPATFDLDAALALLADMPTLWAAATSAERRALLGRLVTHIYARRHEVYALRPTRLAEPLLRALWESRARCNSSPPAKCSVALLTAA